MRGVVDMKVIKTSDSKIVYPPVKIRCGECKSILLIEPEDATLNEHYVWEWYCPICNKPKKSGCAWQMQLIDNETTV